MKNKLSKTVLGLASSFIGMGNSMYSQLMEENQKWEQRQYRWDNKYPEEPKDYQEVLESYKFLGSKAASLGYTPIRTTYVVNEDMRVIWFTIKQVAESIVGKKLPDINPKDAIELAKTTIFSAEDWYKGCTEGAVLPQDLETWHIREV